MTHSKNEMGKERSNSSSLHKGNESFKTLLYTKNARWVLKVYEYSITIMFNSAALPGGKKKMQSKYADFFCKIILPRA